MTWVSWRPSNRTRGPVQGLFLQKNSYIVWLKCVDFGGRGKPEYPNKNSQSTKEISYGYSAHMGREPEPKPGLIFFGSDRQRACATRASPYDHSYVLAPEQSVSEIGFFNIAYIYSNILNML